MDSRQKTEKRFPILLINKAMCFSLVLYSLFCNSTFKNHINFTHKNIVLRPFSLQHNVYQPRITTNKIDIQSTLDITWFKS